MTTPTVDAQFPKDLEFLFDSYRYKVAYGGRGSAKSWSFARALLIQGAKDQLRVLCAREVQKSIKQSVHTLLKDQIVALGLTAFYEIMETEIRGLNGTSFSFAGLASQTIDSIKSFEGADRVWVEEGQSVSKRSWEVLIPTIRKAGSEIWVTFNPELDSDDTYVRFVENPPPDSAVCFINHDDNPWFSDILEQERQHCLAANPEDYPTIWEGKCRSAVVGAIYAKQVAAAVHAEQICNVPYDPRLKTHTIWDLGWNDSMTIIFVQRLRSELRIIDYIEDDHKTLDWYAGEVKSRNYNWGTDWLPHDGAHSDYKTGTSAKAILKSFGRKVKITPNIGVENGIKAARSVFRQCYFDKTKTQRLVECLKRYKRHVNSKTNEPGAPVHDEYSHGADAFRYLGVVAPHLTNEDAVIPKIQSFAPLDPGMGY